jgi:hypothetical protein
MGHLLKIKCIDSKVNVHIFSSTTVSFTLTTVQVSNLALTRPKRITVQYTVYTYVYTVCKVGVWDHGGEAASDR